MCTKKPNPAEQDKGAADVRTILGVDWLVGGTFFSAVMKNKQIELYLLGNGLFLGSISNHHVHRSPAEPLRDALEAALFALGEQGAAVNASKDQHRCGEGPSLLSPVLVALYMFSMGKAEPSPYSKTLERAGMSWVVVTSTFTQFGLQQNTAHVITGGLPANHESRQSWATWSWWAPVL